MSDDIPTEEEFLERQRFRLIRLAVVKRVRRMRALEHKAVKHNDTVTIFTSPEKKRFGCG